MPARTTFAPQHPQAGPAKSRRVMDVIRSDGLVPCLCGRHAVEAKGAYSPVCSCIACYSYRRMDTLGSVGREYRDTVLAKAKMDQESEVQVSKT